MAPSAERAWAGAPPARNAREPPPFQGPSSRHRSDRIEETTMRSILLYFIGVPIPIILLLAMCSHHF